jgi:hypothetical protein
MVQRACGIYPLHATNGLIGKSKKNEKFAFVQNTGNGAPTTAVAAPKKEPSEKTGERRAERGNPEAREAKENGVKGHDERRKLMSDCMKGRLS